MVNLPETALSGQCCHVLTEIITKALILRIIHAIPYFGYHMHMLTRKLMFGGAYTTAIATNDKTIKHLPELSENYLKFLIKGLDLHAGFRMIQR